MNSLHKSLFFAAIVVAALLLCSTQTFAQGISIDLGKTMTGRYMNLVGNTPGGAGEVQKDSVAGEWFAKGVGGSMYFAVDDSFLYQMDPEQFLIVNVEYYDAPGVQIKLVYDAIGNANQEEGQTITTTGTNSWKSKGFILGDAYFGNGQTNGADFHLVATQGTMFINGVSVVPFSAYLNFGAVCDSVDMGRVGWASQPTGDSKDSIITIDGEEVAITLAADNYLYVNVADTFINAGNHPYVFVSVEYYDADPTYQMRLQYDALEAAPGETKNRYKSSAWVNGKGWNSFRTYTFEISDAYFYNRENGGADMRLQLRKPGMAVNQITIGILKKKPWPNTTNIPGFTAYKALESPVVNGSLKDWGWLRPYGVVASFSTSDQSRTDEFYRTWLLNSENVPVAEPGEPGVTDPLTPGLWDANDLGGGVSLLWDDTNLYISAIVKDNVVDVTGADWSQQDGFGLYLDIAHDYKSSGGTEVPIPKKDDATFLQGEHFFFFPATAGELGTWKHSTSQTGEAMPNTITKNVVMTDSGYIIEASIPLDVIRDGLAWKPGVEGDKDNYSPLFGWMLNDADGIGASSGRLMFGAFNDDDEFWSTLNMAPIPLVDKGITVDFGNPNYENYIAQTEKSGDGAVEIVEVDGKNVAKLANGYVYLNVDNAVINAGNHPHLLVSVDYYDSTSGSTNFRLQYDAESAPYKDSYTVNLTGTNKWKTEIFELTDAKFASSQNGGADFRIHCPTNDLFINQVRVGIADLWIDLGDTNSQTAYGISETNLGGDGVRAPMFIGGTWCKRNGRGYPENSAYFYHTVADSLIFNGNHQELFLTAEYYDTTSSGGVGLNYDGMANMWTTAPGEAYILGTSQWKLHTFYIPDAKFQNRENGGSDFRIVGQGNGTTFVNRILVGSTDPIVAGVAETGNQPFTFALSQNYPNPFNPTTTIDYEVPSHGMVTLTIYNLLGQKVADLVHGEQAPGRHTIRWNASNMATGVYFYRLMHNSNVLTKKLLLLK